jgi:uncharacterized CHY-type Zn-finger protein
VWWNEFYQFSRYNYSKEVIKIVKCSECGKVLTEYRTHLYCNDCNEAFHADCKDEHIEDNHTNSIREIDIDENGEIVFI